MKVARKNSPEQSSAAPIVEAVALRKEFGELVAVNNISFSVSHGECFGFLGPNGAGKTSTIRMIYGLSPMTGGNLYVFGLDITQNARTIKSRLGVCHQDNNLDPDLTVRQNLEIFSRYFDMPLGVAQSQAASLLKFMALEHKSDARVMELSGGMMRRLVLARSLLNSPELLILDEPTTGLDPQSRHQVWERLAELKARGLSILISTHNMDEAARLCDRLIIMDHGGILVEGRPFDLIREHVGHDIIEVLEPPPGLRQFVRLRNLEHEDLGHRLIISTEDGNALFREISSEYCKEGCIMRMATLEDVFLKLTGRELRE
ncbi:MAG TPA: ATP-binding cassette domain-containing protein [Syntrophales bacterium]|nr:ATP-binding cassette domain-containing protein [Syntrophales bacterium]